MTGSKGKPQLQVLDDGRCRLSGDLVFATLDGPLSAAHDMAPGNDCVEVDLSGVGRVDSSALALLLQWLQQAKERDRPLRYANVPEALMAIAKLSNVHSLLATEVPGRTSEVS